MEQKVKISDIIIDDRMRKSYMNIESLAESMKSKGQLTPVFLNSDLKLRAGGRRIAAAKLLGWEEINARIFGDNDAIEDLDIEFIENYQRDDFKWHERALGVAKLHAAHKEKDYKWSQRDTAAILGIGKTTVNTMLQLAEAIAAIPGLVELESEKEALRKISAIDEAIYMKELVGRIEKEEKPSPIITIPTDIKAQTKAEMSALMAQIEQLKKEGITDEKGNKILPAAPEYIIGDFFEAAKNMKDSYLGDYSLVECDPPYGIDIQDMKESSPIMMDSYNEIPSKDYPLWTHLLMKELFRIMGNNSRCVYWFGTSWYNMVLSTAKVVGFSVNPIQGIWYKTNCSGENSQPRVNLSNVYESFFILRKGMPILGKFGARNVFAYDMVPDKEKIHPTERPFDLIEGIITTVANVAATSQCLVPFLGSGKTLKVCQKLGIKAFGYDKSQEYRNRYVISK